MSRTVAALYDSRAEAELARNRLVSGAKAKSPRIIAKDTLGAVDGLNIDPKAKARYREAVRDGSSLLVAELPNGTKANQVVDLLDVFVSDSKAEWPPAQLPNQPVADGQPAFQVTDEPVEAPPLAPRQAVEASPPPPRQAVEAPPPARRPAVVPPVAPAEPMRTPAPEPEPATAEAEPPAVQRVAAEPEQRRPAKLAEPVIDEVRVPRIEEQLRVGKREVARGGARVHSFTRESPAEEDVTLRHEVVDVESRPSERHLSDAEVEAGGLFKNRVIDVAEMREEPVVTKTAVVREEVIIRKRVVERVETVRDTVRRTQIEVEDLSAEEAESAAPRFFSRAGHDR